MRLIPALCLLALTAACSSEETANNTAAAAPAPTPTGPAPRTPTMNVAREPGKTPDWLRPADNAGAPTLAPYGNLLDQPVVDAPTAK